MRYLVNDLQTQAEKVRCDVQNLQTCLKNCGRLGLMNWDYSRSSDQTSQKVQLLWNKYMLILVNDIFKQFNIHVDHLLLYKVNPLIRLG